MPVTDLQAEVAAVRWTQGLAGGRFAGKHGGEGSTAGLRRRSAFAGPAPAVLPRPLPFRGGADPGGGRDPGSAAGSAPAASYWASEGVPLTPPTYWRARTDAAPHWSVLIWAPNSKILKVPAGAF